MINSSGKTISAIIFVFIMIYLPLAIPGTIQAEESPLVNSVRTELAEYGNNPNPNYVEAMKIMSNLINTVEALACVEDPQMTIDGFNVVSEYLDILSPQPRAMMASVDGQMAYILMRQLNRPEEGMARFNKASDNLDFVLKTVEFSESVLQLAIYGLSHSGANIYLYKANHAVDPADVENYMATALEMATKCDTYSEIFVQMVGRAPDSKVESLQIELFQEPSVDYCWDPYFNLLKIGNAQFEFVIGNTGIIRKGNRLEFATAQDLENQCQGIENADFFFLAEPYPLNHMRLLWLEIDDKKQEMVSARNPVLPRILSPDWVDAQVQSELFFRNLSWQNFDKVAALLPEAIKNKEIINIDARNLVYLPDPQNDSSSEKFAWFINDGDTAFRITQLTSGADFMFRYLREKDLPFVGAITFTSIENDPKLRAIDHAGIGHIVGEMKVNWFQVAHSYIQGTPMECDGFIGLETQVRLSEDTEKETPLPPGLLVHHPEDEIQAVFSQIATTTDSLAFRSWRTNCGWESRVTLIEEPELQLPAGQKPGVVILKFLVGKENQVTGPRVIYTTNSDLENEAYRMLQKCQFKAKCYLSGETASEWALMMFDFRE